LHDTVWFDVYSIELTLKDTVYKRIKKYMEYIIYQRIILGSIIIVVGRVGAALLSQKSTDSTKVTPTSEAEGSLVMETKLKIIEILQVGCIYIFIHIYRISP